MYKKYISEIFMGSRYLKRMFGLLKCKFYIHVIEMELNIHLFPSSASNGVIIKLACKLLSYANS